MNKLDNWCKSNNWENCKITSEQISKKEEIYNISFPKAYKEFLGISGKECIVVPLGRFFEYADENQSRAKELLNTYKLNNLIEKPFWVIATEHGAFWYFHLDDGDNPPVYRLDCEFYGDMDDIYTFGPVAGSFQEWVEKGIEFYENDPENQ